VAGLDETLLVEVERDGGVQGGGPAFGLGVRTLGKKDVRRPRAIRWPVPRGGTMMRISVQRPAEGVAVVAMAGEIDAATAATLSTRLHLELEHQPAVLVLDLTGVDFLGVAGLKVLDCAAARARTLSAELRLVHHDPPTVNAALRAEALTGDGPAYRTVIQAIDHPARRPTEAGHGGPRSDQLSEAPTT
jgi:anti-anti-sigma factor